MKEWKEREERSGTITRIQARMKNEKERVGKAALYVYGGEEDERKMAVREKRKGRIAELRGQISEMDPRQERPEELIEWALKEMAKGKGEMAVTERDGREELKTAVKGARWRITRKKEMLETLSVKLDI
jgi:hypothetical protein